MYGNMMYGPWMPPPPWYSGGPTNNRGLTIAEAIEGEEFFKKLKKDLKDEEDKHRHKKKETRRFTFLELCGLLVIAGPLVGAGYLYMLKSLITNMDQFLNVVPH